MLVSILPKYDFNFHGLGSSRSHLLATTLPVTRRHKLECPTRSIFTLILEYSMRVPEQVQGQPSLLEPNPVPYQLSELPPKGFGSQLHIHALFNSCQRTQRHPSPNRGRVKYIFQLWMSSTSLKGLLIIETLALSRNFESFLC